MSVENIQKNISKTKKVAFPAGALLAPVPVVIVTCGSMVKPSAITIAWTGILASDPPKTYISVRHERNSYNIIKESGEFVINLVNKRLVFAADYCGIKSGKIVNKFEDMHFETSQAKFVKCPTINQSPLNIECRVTEIIPLGSHDMFIADILGVNVDPKYVDSDGRICLDEAYLVSYCHGEYFLLGEKLGKFGYSTSSTKPINIKIKPKLTQKKSAKETVKAKVLDITPKKPPIKKQSKTTANTRFKKNK